jgi:serine/threonine protein kinase/tetratricopeptide (TPR) repeat protein
MNPDKHRIDSIFLAAAEKATADERAAYLDGVCGADRELRERVERLLAAQSKVHSFLEAPAPALLATVDEPPVTERPGTLIGPYKLLEQIGEGGFGVVFMAEQSEPIRRKVALKVLKPGMDTRQVVARFEAERQALALMDHPNIARVLDGGQTTSGRPYFVMDLVKGLPITEYCDQAQLAPRERLELFVHLCSAVQHAHQKGIIHRDLKPSNVLVTLHDGTPLVKVIDFGIAKALGHELTDKTLFTGFAQMIGTPLYMSPEQAGQSGLDIDTRSDIYSLGVLLYELLTGTTPFDKERLKEVGYDELRRIIREEEPPRPSTRISTLGQAASTLSAQRKSDPNRLASSFRGELDWIVMKSLEKDRNRRYETASALAADVQRYLADEPVQACPPSAGYRLRKFARRNRGPLAAAAVLGLALLVGAGGVGWVALDRAARRGKAATNLELVLDRAELFLEGGKRAEALAAFERAELLAGEARPDPAREERLAALKERLAADARDHEFITRFEDIRLRVQSEVNVTTSRFADEAALPEIREALDRYGIAIGVQAPAQVAAHIQGRPEPVRRDLIAALDECLRYAPPGSSQTRQWLLAALAAADNDTWRVRVRKAVADRNEKVLEQLALAADFEKQSPGCLLLMVNSLPAQMQATRLELLRRVQRAYPGDLWANHNLAFFLHRAGRSAEAFPYYTAALALRPHNPGIYLNRGNARKDAGEIDAAIADYRQAVALAPGYVAARANLGLALYRQGDLDGAIAEYRKTIDIRPDFAETHCGLGVVLRDKGRLDDAIAEFHTAIRLDRDKPIAHANLGVALLDKGHLDDAIVEFHTAIRLDKDDPVAHYGFGRALRKKGDLRGATAEFRRAIALKPDFAEAHCNLGLALQLQGEFHQALEELRRGNELGLKDPRWRWPSRQWVRQCERRVELDERLPGILARKATPASPAERVELAGLCSLKGLHGTAVRFYEEAFVTQPKLADALGGVHRYRAAEDAALAGCGAGKDADQIEAKERARMRGRALDWLSADLAAWVRRLDTEPDKARAAAALTTALKYWLASPAFAGMRGPEALSKLPEAERQPWQKLWKDVAETLARVRRTPQKKEEAE